MTAPNLETPEGRRKVLTNLKRQNTRITNRIREASKEEQTSAWAQVLLSQLVEYHERLNELVEQLDEDDKMGIEIDELTDDNETKQIILKQIIEDQIEHRSNPSLVTPTMPARAECLKLKELELPMYNGDPCEWQSFWDMFRLNVHDHEGLSGRARFSYLKATLTGKAAETIKHLSVNDVNYPLAIQLLTNQCGRPRMIASSLLDRVSALPKAQSLDQSKPEPLRQVATTLRQTCHALDNLGEEYKRRDLWVLHAIRGKVPPTVWLDYEKTLEFPTPDVDSFVNFLEKQVNSLENVGETPPSFHQKQTKTRTAAALTKRETENNNTNTKNTIVECPKCKGTHKIFNCPVFNQASNNERTQIVIDLGLCYNCLAKSHGVSHCKSMVRCKHCQRKHNTLLHRTEGKGKEEDTPGTETVHTTTCASVFELSSNTTSVLPTMKALVSIKTKYGWSDPTEMKVLLDSASDETLIEERQIPVSALTIEGPNVLVQEKADGSKSKHFTKRVELKIISKVQPQTVLTRGYAYSAPQLVTTAAISGEEEAKVNKALALSHAGPLADPHYAQNEGVQIILAAAKALPILLKGQLIQAEKMPYAVQTQGGVIPFAIPSQTRTERPIKVACATHGLDQKEACELLTAFQRMWERDGMINKSETSNEEFCEQHFRSTYKRDEDGKYCVRIPFSQSASLLQGSYAMAHKRLRSTINRMIQDEDFKKKYIEQRLDFEKVGHLIQREPLKGTKTPGVCYLPHHAVIRPHVTTTKVRMVFDASARHEGGLAHNDLAIVGPNLQESLCSLLLRFRIGKYVLTADIEKWYRQVRVNPLDWDTQRILWAESHGETPREYALTVVAFGTASAPYLAQRALVQCAQDETTPNSELRSIILNNFYMDDLMISRQNANHLLQIAKRLRETLLKGGFPLCKFKSNEPVILKQIGHELCEITPLDLIEHEEKECVKKVLGLAWQPTHDEFRIVVGRTEQNETTTRRDMLSFASAVYDPLGWIAPISITAKFLLRELAQNSGNKWDEAIPIPLQLQWNKWVRQLRGLEEIRIPRWHGVPERVALFCDASSRAYGACVYAENAEGEWNLVMAKSRIAPCKGTTIPRLELAAMCVGTELLTEVLRVYQLEGYQPSAHAFSDSAVALAWLRLPPAKLQIFVANRVQKIRQMQPALVWRHIPTKQNPADLITRGSNVAELATSELWWKGPGNDWIDGTPADTKELTPLEKEMCIQEQKTVSCATTLTRVPSPINTIMKHSSTLASATRIIRSWQKIAQRLSPTKREFKRKPIHLCCRQAQLDAWPQLRTSPDKAISTLPKGGLQMVNVDGLWRLIGRRSPQYYDKAPIIIPSQSRIAQLVLRAIHERLDHASAGTILADAREKYFIVGGKKQAQQIIKECIVCQRETADRKLSPIGPLHKNRITPFKPFECINVDLAGPFLYQQRRAKGPAKEFKLWLMIACCATTRGVHLELLPDLTSQATYAALQRMFARRGRPAIIVTDNGTNFTAVKNEWERSDHKTGFDTIPEWRTTPPRSPHHNGSAEAMVKLVKRQIHKVIKQRTLTWLEWYHFSVLTEGILNSRPIAAGHEDSDFPFLTPAHFLIQRGLQTTPLPPPGRPNDLDLMCRYKLSSDLYQQIQKQWKQVYLQPMWDKAMKSRNDEYCLGDLCLMKKGEHATEWPIGRIIETYPGNDGKIRVVKLKTATGEFIRDIQALRKLYVPKAEDESLRREVVERLAKASAHYEGLVEHKGVPLAQDQSSHQEGHCARVATSLN